MTSTGSFLIVVGFDGSEYSQAALDWAMDEARQRNGRLRLVTAWNKPPMAWYPAVLETAAGEIAAEESPERIAQTLQGEAVKSAEDSGVTATGQLVGTHSPASAILDAAKDADLIVVGSRGHGGFPGLHVGSVSTQVVNHAQCPVLVVRSNGAR
ncbi:universal stress protein [Arthrobacter sp. SLBN-112]|uniref:universal stress protein n=1 Tax=Arthrobacter sp. SLBN-112 TaxID=2768452 RepID=UPI0027ADF39C|nr:universal stress protein [Arthrobacter sp. SLBN-112]MDQ0802182.1 nucleotide-binding universal stress UspA family protein [Arthrobacter sp. SLBN-112]